MVGTVLCRSLTDHGFPVLQLVRRTPQSPDQLQWDPAEALRAPGLLEGLTAAIHLSGANVAAHRWTPEWKQEIRSSRVDSTRALAQTLASLKNPPQTLLVASATGIYGDRGDEILDESSAPGHGFLAEVCQQWEAAAKPAVDAGIRVVHLRLGVVIGPGAGALAKLVPLFRLGLGGRLGSGRQWMSWISLADAVSAMLFALDTPSLSGPLNFTAPQPVTNADFTRALARAVHRPALIPAPAFALRIAMGQMADEALLASARVLPAKLTGARFPFAHPTIDKALAAAISPQI
jgi:uncharacterized protein (TIGR01777 family)